MPCQLVARFPPATIFNHTLVVFTVRSARSLDREWNGAVRICVILFLDLKWATLALVKYFLWSVAKLRGVPKRLYTSCKQDTVNVLVSCFIGTASIHWQWASTTTKNILSLKRPKGSNMYSKPNCLGCRPIYWWHWCWYWHHLDAAVAGIWQALYFLVQSRPLTSRPCYSFQSRRALMSLVKKV